MTQAQRIMLQFNPHALICRQGSKDLMIEDISDPDGRMYRIEYQSSHDGHTATALCLFNPWDGPPYSGNADLDGHIFQDGRICMGEGRRDLVTVIQRARYWCTAYSVYKEQGKFPNP